MTTKCTGALGSVSPQHVAKVYGGCPENNLVAEALSPWADSIACSLDAIRDVESELFSGVIHFSATCCLRS